MEQLEQFIAEMENKKPSMPKASKDLLIHRNIELHLAKQGQYTKATRVKDAADRMEIAEMESTLATFEAELSLKVWIHDWQLQGCAVQPSCLAPQRHSPLV